MTNEEAKKLLQNNLDFENGKKGIYPCPIEQYKLALEVAIEALNTQDDLCENLAWYINERQRLLKVIEYSKPNEGLQRTIKKALERPHGEKKCPVCGNDLYEYCFSCCYEGEKVT